MKKIMRSLKECVLGSNLVLKMCQPKGWFTENRLFLFSHYTKVQMHENYGICLVSVYIYTHVCCKPGRFGHTTHTQCAGYTLACDMVLDNIDNNSY